MDPLLQKAYSTERFRDSAHRIVDLLSDHLETSTGGRHRQALPWVEPELALEHWRALADQGIGIEQLCEQMLKRSVRISDPKYMGHQICTPAPTAALAGFITECLNNGSGVYEMGMAGTAMEKVVVQTVARQFGMPETSDGVMTSGGTLANLTAMLAARSMKSGGQDWTDGTQKKLAVMVSDQAHYCIDRAVRIMGWGDAGIIRVPSNEQYAMRVSELPRLYAEAEAGGQKVVAVVGSACSTSTGSFDDLRTIGDFCNQHGLWFHVDGAHGAAVAFSEKHRHLIGGVELADSVVVDFHKMMMTPVLSSALVFKRKLDSFRAFAIEADYLFARDSNEHEMDEFNLAKRTFECTKPMLSSKVFSLLAVYGTRLFEANIDQLQKVTQEFATLLQAHPQFNLAIQPQINIVCFRYQDESVDRKDLSNLNARVRDALTREGRYYIVQTVLRGETWLRTTLSNPFTSSVELQGLLDRIVEIAQACKSDVGQTC